MNNNNIRSDVLKRYVTLRRKIRLISSLRAFVSLPSNYNISKSQWLLIEHQLLTAEAKYLNRLNEGARKYFPTIHEAESGRAFNELMGRVELDLSDAFTFFDTFLDIISQRLLPKIGRLLEGCDTLAMDALRKNHPALIIIEKPLVFLDRGFGASILREGITLPDGSLNPLPAIQIPYSKLMEKYNLTSVIHETGHSAMVRLGLVVSLPKMTIEVLENAGAPKTIHKLFALWMKEIGPDFWGFCNCGIAQPSSVREILSLPKNYVFKVSSTDPHPPPFLRVLLAIEWCRQQWGSGIWDAWERSWTMMYPMKELRSEEKKIISTAKEYIPTVSHALFRTRFRTLNGGTILSLFDIDAIAPTRLENVVRKAQNSNILNLKGFSPGGQLAVFRMIRERGILSEESLDQLMTEWLVRLGKQRKG